MNSPEGQQTWGWLLGEGEARGIALVFLVSGLVMVVLALLAFTTRSYRILSAEYEVGAPLGAPTSPPASVDAPSGVARE